MLQARKMKDPNITFDLALTLLKDIFEDVPDMAVNLLNRDFTVLWANKMMAQAVETPLKDMIGRPCYEVWRRRTDPCPVCMLNVVIETKQPCIMERWLDLPNRERKYAQVRAYPVFDENGSVKHAFEIIIPITNKKDEMRRRRYIESLEGTVRTMNAGVLALNDRPGNDPGEASLTGRERQIIRLVARGFSNKEIADILLISHDTVKTHLRNIFSKTGASDRTQAAIFGLKHNIV
jgi:DNA-binding CsgD family transcriptional regulator